MRSRFLGLGAAALLAFTAADAVAAPLVGPGVGNADALGAEGNRLYNRKQFKEAARIFLQASRADAGRVGTYLSLARSRFGARQIAPACYAYRVYVRAAPESEERNKASSELELCERQMTSARVQAEESQRQFVETKAAFFAALEGGKLVGIDGAGAWLERLVNDGYLGPDLGEMASKLAFAASSAAEELHRRALAHEAIAPAKLQEGTRLFDLAASFGVEAEGQGARRSFLEGLAEMQLAEETASRGATVGASAIRDATAPTGTFARAISLFAAAADAAPAVTEYRFFEAMALWRSGDRAGALAKLRRDLPSDPRTLVLGAAQELEASPARGAAELERVLFTTRYPGNR